MTVVAESGDHFIGAAAMASETEYQRGVRHLVELLSKLNPSAKEFVPTRRLDHPRLSADAPSFDYFSNGQDSSSDGSSNNQQQQINRRRRNGNYNQSRRRMNDRYGMEEQIRRTIYVSDVTGDVTEEALANIFKHYGHVVDCRVCGDPHSFLRFAFIEFSREGEARAALNLDGTMLVYYPLRVLPSKTAIVPVNPKFLPKSEDEREMVGRTVYCTNIDTKVTQAEVKDFFERLCGTVKRLRLLLDNKHATCIAFVEFAEAASATMALSYSGVPLGALPIRVSPSKTPVRPPRNPRAIVH